MEKYNEYLNKILSLEDKDKICGEIYKITNVVNGNIYIGQTVSHRKNKNKYRPFGYTGRFNDHLSVARNKTKKGSTCYLYNAIRQYGENNFKTELLLRCELNESDFWETEKIKEYNSIFPSGYNLTKGGKTARYEPVSYKINETLNESRKRGGCTERSIETRKLISERQKNHLSSKEVLLKKSELTINQHLEKKFKMFNHILIDDIDTTNIEKYIHIVHENKTNRDYVRIVIKKIRNEFNSKHETLEQLKNRARLFLNELIKTKATLSNCSGTP